MGPFHPPVAETLPHTDRRDSRAKEQRRGCVPEVMEPDAVTKQTAPARHLRSRWGKNMSRTRLRTPSIALSAATLMLTVAAHADSACLKDAERFCSGIPIGEGRVVTCLQARWRDLSGACQHELQEIQNRAREITLSCTNDVWQFCQNVVPGGDRIRVCLWSRWNELSSTCREKAAEVAEKAQQLSDHCGGDIDRLCPGMKPGGGQIYLCLKAQESKVSSQCRRALR